MKHTLLALVLATSFTSIMSQVLVQQAQLDSMIQLIKANPKEDSLRIRLLTDYAKLCFYDLDFLNGLKATNEVRSLSKKMGFRKGEAMYFESMAIFQRFNSRFAKYYQVQANWILNRNTNFGPFEGLIMPVGTKDRDFKTIHTNLEQAIPYAESLDDKEALANIHLAISYNSYLNNDLKQASDHSEIALAKFRELNLSYPQLHIITEGIWLVWLKGNAQEAKALELQAANIYLAEKNKRIKALGALDLGWMYGENSRAFLSLDYHFQASDLLKETQEKDLLRSVYLAIAFVYKNMLEKPEIALDYYNKDIEMRKDAGYFEGIEDTYLRIAQVYVELKRPQEIPESYWASFEKSKRNKGGWFKGSLVSLKGRIKLSEGKSQEALQLFRQAVIAFDNDTRGASFPAQQAARLFREMKDLKSAIQYGLLSYDLGSKTSYLPSLIISSELLSQLYEESGQPLKALEYLKLSRSLKEKSDELNNAARLAEVEVQAALQKSQREIELLQTESDLKAQENKAQRFWIISIGGALLFAVILASLLYRNNLSRKKANTQLNLQKREIEEAYGQLKSTQSQLIQSEKMASLGELTAGIAHEIQNPLNFVNNFSELNKELIGEMETEIEKANYDGVKQLAKNIKENQEKIDHHGKRADSIVKGMLQHSRSNSGVKEPTDINALADEYLRLAYHGLRAKDKSFNATTKTDFDQGIGKINVVPQDIGRVILNLITNAFYVVTERKKLHQENYEPTVIVSTKKTGKKIVISVQDNGNGIPQKFVDKIFQPFFTTKPAGQGTGLGLSLSYDIVKAHGGELKVETKDGEGAEFIIILPNS